MSDKKANDSAFGGSNRLNSSDDIADLLASISSPKSDEGRNQSTQALGRGELSRRKHYRHPVRWRVAVVNKSGGKDDIYHGRTGDVSLSGISVLLERNMSFTSEVVVLLAIPPMHQGQKETIVEIQCGVTHTVLDFHDGLFRLGMQFIHFKGEGQRILADVLSKRHIPKQDSNPYRTV